ncbi:uncharacterized protein LOC118646766 [Monomorium pharaonis]|uniref:uncharacterized protein LOC118646766 n=1 Tax=Monomorium pharaonis TaxID=307658 RepID=UPI001745EEAB|nr:uncharacterized protein LOC118646766 [Monomorium pharaonis]
MANPSRRRPTVVDITSLDYGAHRHRLIEATLKKKYDDRQPPGDVVLNSLHLNAADSVIGVRLNDRYDHSFFDFVEEYYVARGAGGSRENVERSRPLDHFLPTGRARRPRTSEKETETTIPGNGADRGRSNGNHLPENGNPAKLPGTDDNGNPCGRDALSSTGDRDAPVSRGYSLPRENQTITAERDASHRATSPGTSREAGGTESPRTSESKKRSEDQPTTIPVVPPLSADKRSAGGGNGGGGRSSFVSASSGEIASVRSRESSPSRRPPWMSGNGGTSFNRKYCGETFGSCARPMSARGSVGPQRSAAPSSQGIPRAVGESPAASTRLNPALLLAGRRKAVSFVAASPRSGSKERVVATGGIDNEAKGRAPRTLPRRCPTTTARRRRSPRTADAPAAAPASETAAATKAAELITTSRSNGAEGARGRRGPTAAVGNNARDRREDPPSPTASAKLNPRGGRRRRLRSAENPSEGASLSPQIELSAEVLNPGDDTDKSAIPDGGAGRRPAQEGLARARIDPRGRNTSEREARSDVKSNSIVDQLSTTSSSRVTRGRPASANDLPAARDANATLAVPRGDEDSLLQLPRRDSKIGLAMNSALRSYVERLKRGLLNDGDRDGVVLASLSLSDAVAVLSEEQRTPLSPVEIQELQAVLDRVERNPELLCKLSCHSGGGVA